MKRRFNVTGSCNPRWHYMVRLDDRVKKIKEEYVDYGSYFVINRGRQYGKTTTLRALAKYLWDDYIVLAMDFQIMSTANFADEQTFVRAFIRYIEDLASDQKMTAGIRDEDLQALIAMRQEEQVTMDDMFRALSRIIRTADKRIVLMIDEVDSASNNQVFIDFLAQLRGYYLRREDTPAFHSVIFAGVYDIKNLKLKLRSESEHQYNSPWNIAAAFNIPMSFSSDQIGGMLDEYETDHQTGMDVRTVADTLYQYTSGYPYLVSALCKIMDEELPFQEKSADGRNVWTVQGVEKAVKCILQTRTTLFDSMIKHISEYPDLKQMLHMILFQGEEISYNGDNHTIELGCMFGYIVDGGVYVQVANRIFETRLYNLFLSEEEVASAMSTMAKQGFNFNKKKEIGVKTIAIGDKELVEAVV